MALSLILVMASMSSLNLSLPELGRDMGATTRQLTWIVDAYTLALAATVLPFGALGDRLGRKRVLLVGMAIFGLAAAGAALQDTPTGIIVARTVMGFGAALIMPATLATITAAFPVEKRAQGIATWVGFAGAGAVAGIVAAGLMLEVWSWHSIFVFSAIIAVIASIAVTLFSPDTRDEHHPGIDIPGALLSGIMLLAFVFGLIEGGELGWTSWVALLSFSVAVAALVGFILVELRTRRPLLDVRVFRNGWFTVGTIAVTTQFMAQLGFIFIAMQFLQIVLGFSPLQSAIGFLPLALVVLPMSQATPRLIDRIGSRAVIVAGMIMLALGLFVQTRLTAESSYWHFLGGLVVAGIGMAWTATPATSAITGSLPRHKQGVASAVNDATREVGATIGVAIMGTAFGRGYEAAIAPSIVGLPEKMQEIVLKSPSAAVQLAEQSGPQGKAMLPKIQDAFMIGTSDGNMALVLTVAAMALAVLIIAPGSRFTSSEDS